MFSSTPSFASPAARRRWPFGLKLATGWLAAMCLVALFAPVLAPYGYEEQDLLSRLAPPVFLGGSSDHLLGADHLGRDVLSRLIYAIRISAIVALAGTVIGAVLGTLLGVLAAQWGGLFEEAVMALVDAQSALPFLIFALLIIAFFGNNLALFILLLGFQGWERYARLARGLVLDANTRGYARAARAMGLAEWRVTLIHLAPNIAGAILVQFTINLPETILLEAGLSFVGLGIQPPMTSLGLMLNESRGHMVLHWWLAALPALAIFLTALAISLLGDSLRDRLDHASH
ncbi:ABC transporter permease [Mameliella sediminis]|uniref:ABC transporter permease n=1 Tax=Mameliella sediminis TaxID=2836866 RepID=UPI001C45C1FB|nr:ABC transporter permease [Mameliella sediminis]MBV7396914.1 ABC transporter permease [Mameliella sediminis]